MKPRFTLLIVLLTGLLGVATDVKSVITLKLPEGATYKIDVTREDEIADEFISPLIAFCHDRHCISKTYFFNYEEEPNGKITVQQYSPQIQVTFKSPDKIVYQWTHKVEDGKKYAITISESKNVISQKMEELLSAIDVREKKFEETSDQQLKDSANRLRKEYDRLSRLPH